MGFIARRFCLISLVVLVGADAASAQPSGACRLVSERSSELGCWIIAHESLGTFVEAQTYWHLDTFSNRPDAEAAKGSRGTVVESMGRVWLFTIDARGWRPTKGERVAEIG